MATFTSKTAVAPNARPIPLQSVESALPRPSSKAGSSGSTAAGGSSHALTQTYPPTPASKPLDLVRASASAGPSSAIVKRKAEEMELGVTTSGSSLVTNHGSGPAMVKYNGEATKDWRIKRDKLNHDVGYNNPIAVLPLPLPSKRFKKKPTSKAVLIPVEQLPVIALPPMPTIDDPELHNQVFTHQSLFEKQRGKFEDPKGNMARHYEKLEHVGDSILGMLVTTWLHETKPELTIGTATKLKSHLVSNATLSHISGLYGLPQRLHGDPNLLPVLRSQTDTRAALVEAYIAALYFSFPEEERLTTGLGVIDRWLREMYEPLYDFFYSYMKSEYEQHHLAVGAGIDGHVQMQSDAEMARIDVASLGMAALVQMYTNKQDRELRWEDQRYETALGSLWRVKCTVDGIELGEGVRTAKRNAKNVAGLEAARKLGLVAETFS
ncbi:hypothetical protein IAT38_002455 [Cryptococcus sp. DSM 104549]